jgi:hypothetical protein
MPLWCFALPLELEIAGDGTSGVQDEALIIELQLGVILEVLALLAVPPHQWRTATAGILVHEAHYSSSPLLSSPKTVLKPRDFGFEFFDD